MPSELAHHWILDPTVRFLNHGSFGATPRVVLEAQSRWRDRMEREPVDFFDRQYEPALDAVRVELATHIGADPDDLALLRNASAAIATVVRSLDLRPGDELLATDHAYNAARNTLEAAAAAAQANVVLAEIPFPGATPDLVISAIMDCVTPRTRLALIDHVTSPTALVLPVAEIVTRLAERGVDTIVDGAHAPGMLQLDLDHLGAAYYAGNCHKWLCAPKGAAFLHVRRDRQHLVRPLVVSHGANSVRTDRSRFRLEHDWTGTDDPSALLSIADGIRFGAALLPGGWPALHERNRWLALTGRDLVCDALATPRPTPDQMIGSMASVPLPGDQAAGRVPFAQYGDAVHDALLADGIQVAITRWPLRPDGRPWRRLVRLSAAPYTAREDLEQLADALCRHLP